MNNYKKYLILAIKTFIIAGLILLLLWYKGWDIYDFIAKYRTSENQIIDIVQKHNLYCDGNILMWGKAPDLSGEYCSNFKGLKINTNDFIYPCD